jgi:serine/threonine-protein phosphatase 4 regulatory subunit 1
LIIKQQQQ